MGVTTCRAGDHDGLLWESRDSISTVFDSFEGTEIKPRCPGVAQRGGGSLNEGDLPGNPTTRRLQPNAPYFELPGPSHRSPRAPTMAGATADGPLIRLSTPNYLARMSLRERTRPGLGLIEPCLPSPAKAPPSGPGWLHEIKHDGFRILARRDSAGVRLITRAGNDFSSRFPFIAMAVGMLPVRSCLIDGEAMFAKDHMQRTNKFAQIILRLINYFEAHDDGP